MHMSAQKQIGLRCACLLLCAANSAGAERPVAVQRNLAIAGENRRELLQVYEVVPKARHGAVDFILANMPSSDAKSLSAEFIAQHIDYAYRARNKFPWAGQTPDDIFLSDVLPYASLNERRDAWRKGFFEKFAPIVADCKTAGEAAIRLNKRIYDLVDVHYSRGRPKPDQSPFESIEAGKASCTGLSILLVDACRAVGVPARVVGTPLWINKSGNHTWVEVWDDGWHFIGASESSALNRAWFAGQASKQVKGDVAHAIYAAHFEKTDLHFPLVWARANKDVPAIDVTHRYAVSPAGVVSLREASEFLGSAPLVQLLDELETADKLFPMHDLASVKKIAWAKYTNEVRSSVLRQKEHKEMAVTYHDKTMRYRYKRVGEKPVGGCPLYIALHGGGGAPKAVNDSQWRHMQSYYLGGVTSGVYLAARGVCDAWNMHWLREAFVCYDRIIENMIVFEHVDPNKVYLLGFSAGGDAVYQVPARTADRWAGAAMSAGHPNGVRPDNYASLAFLIQVGELDRAYSRNKVAAQYGVRLGALRKEHTNHYRHAAYVHKGRGHGFRDHDPRGEPQNVYANCGEWLEKGAQAATTNANCNSIHWLDQFTRDPLPQTVIWDCGTSTDRTGGNMPGFWPTAEKGKLHYWIGIDRYTGDLPLEAKRIVATYDRAFNAIAVSEVGNFVRLYLSPRMLDLDREVTVQVDGRKLSARPSLSLRMIVQSLLDRGDPSYMFPACLTITKNPEGDWLLSQ